MGVHWIRYPDRLAGTYDLTQSQAYVLAVMIDRATSTTGDAWSVTRAEICAVTGYAPRTVTAAIAALVDKALLVRRETDGRRQAYALGSAAQGLLPRKSTASDPHGIVRTVDGRATQWAYRADPDGTVHRVRMTDDAVHRASRAAKARDEIDALTRAELRAIARKDAEL